MGKLKAKADIIRLSISISSISKSVKEAQKNVNQIMNNVLRLLEDHEIEKDWIQTTDLNFRTKYEWDSDKHRNILIGQMVEHEIICTIPNLATRLNTVRDILDSITLIYDSIECKLSFDIGDYESKIAMARESAYTDAYNKAKKYAELSGVKIIRAVKISEFEPSTMDSGDYGNFMEIAGPPESAASTELSIGSIILESKLYCDFIAN